MSTRPPIIAVDDELESIELRVDGDPADAILDARTSLHEFDVRDASSQAQSSHLDDAEAALLRAQEQVSGDEARRLEAIRNRIGIYRDNVVQTDEDLAVIDSTVRTEETDAEAADESLADLRDDRVELVATVVNSGTARRVIVAVGLYDDTGDELVEFTSEDVTLDADEQTPVTFEFVVPEDAVYYATRALDANTQTVG